MKWSLGQRQGRLGGVVSAITRLARSWKQWNFTHYTYTCSSGGLESDTLHLYLQGPEGCTQSSGILHWSTYIPLYAQVSAPLAWRKLRKQQSVLKSCCRDSWPTKLCNLPLSRFFSSSLFSLMNSFWNMFIRYHSHICLLHAIQSRSHGFTSGLASVLQPSVMQPLIQHFLSSAFPKILSVFLYSKTNQHPL